MRAEGLTTPCSTPPSSTIIMELETGTLKQQTHFCTRNNSILQFSFFIPRLRNVKSSSNSLVAGVHCIRHQSLDIVSLYKIDVYILTTVSEM